MTVLRSYTGGTWTAQHSESRSFPHTEQHVFRAEFTGLTPGTEYQFRISTQPTVYRFRTMPAKANAWRRFSPCS